MAKRYDPPPIDPQPVSIYTQNNPYGYKYNINHPKIRELYERYKEWKGIHTVLSDEERFEFEDYLTKHFDKSQPEQLT